MSFDLNGAQVVARFNPQPVYQRNNLLILECKSTLGRGGVTVRKGAYDWLATFKDQYDCGVLLTNVVFGWSKLVSLADLPVKEPREGLDGAYWIIDPSDFGTSSRHP